MLATTELLGEAAARPPFVDLLPRWRELPVYRSRGLPPVTFSPAEATDDFFALPFITKREMRENFPDNFLPAGQSLEALLADGAVELEHTSGTSEERVPVLFGRGWWNAQEQRVLRLNPFVGHVLDEHPAARRVVLTTPLCNGSACHSRWAPASQRTLGDALYVNQARIPFLLPASELDRMAGETADWAPQFLDLDPVHGAWFALHCERRGLRFPSLRFVLCSYEFVSVVHRRIIERAFGVPVFNLYGATETGHLLMEDTAGALKPCDENAFLEVVDRDAAGVGQLVVTTLTNDYMPLVRYRIGDLVQQSRSPNAASFVVHGRARDALQSADGRRVTTWEVDHCFSGLDGLAHYQFRQAENGDCQVRFVPEGSGLQPEETRQLITRLETLLQRPGGILVESADVLGPAPSGKYRLTSRQ